MKHLAPLLGLFLVLLSLIAEGKSRRFGLGVMVGNPTGLSANYWVKKRNSLDGGLAFDLGDGDFHLHSTYLFHFLRSMNIDQYYFGWYLGAGGRLVSRDRKNKDDEIELGPRGSIGLRFPIERRMFDVFAEFALIMNLIESTHLDADFAIGGRYYF